MENIKKQENMERYLTLCFVFNILIILYQGIYQENILSMVILFFMLLCVLFYYRNKKIKDRQLDYFIHCCDCVIDQKEFQIIDGESKESLLSHKLFILNKRYHQTLETIHQEQLKLKNYIEDISHQLKTPITAIRINTELLIEEQNDKRLIYIYHQIQRIQNLVSDLQTVALIDSHNIVFDFKRYELEDIIDEIQEDLAYLNPTLLLNQNIELFCDYKWFIEALENIIKNCLETSHSNINIDVIDNETTHCLIIRDHGMGINEKDLQYLFHRFYRGKGSKGTGLGLYISKEIIEAHHGLIHAYNDQGACFEIIIPKLNVKKKL